MCESFLATSIAPGKPRPIPNKIYGPVAQGNFLCNLQLNSLVKQVIEQIACVTSLYALQSRLRYKYHDIFFSDI